MCVCVIKPIDRNMLLGKNDNDIDDELLREDVRNVSDVVVCTHFTQIYITLNMQILHHKPNHSHLFGCKNNSFRYSKRRKDRPKSIKHNHPMIFIDSIYVAFAISIGESMGSI